MNKCSDCKFSFISTDKNNFYRACTIDDGVVNAYGCEKNLNEVEEDKDDTNI